MARFTDKELDRAMRGLRKAKNAWETKEAYKDDIELALAVLRSGRLALEATPLLWENLAEHPEALSVEEVLHLLRHLPARPKPEDFIFAMPGWPREIDRIVTFHCARDPTPFQTIAEQLPTPLALGVSFALHRVGVDVGKTRRRQILRALGTVHADAHGVVLWVPKGGQWIAVNHATGASITDFLPSARDPSFDETLGSLGDLALFDQQALKREIALSKKRRHNNREMWSVGPSVYARATVDEMKILAGSNRNHAAAVSVFHRFRGDSAADLLAIALGANEHPSRPAWQTQDLAVANLAAEAFSAEGKPIPEPLLPLLVLDIGFSSSSDPSRGEDDDEGWPIAPPYAVLQRTLRSLGEAKILELIEAHEGSAPKVVSLVSASSRPETWRRGLELLGALDCDFSYTKGISLPLGTLPLDALPLLQRAHESAKNPSFAVRLHSAILILLARAVASGAEIPASADALLAPDATHATLPIEELIDRGSPVRVAHLDLLSRLPDDRVRGRRRAAARGRRPPRGRARHVPRRAPGDASIRPASVRTPPANAPLLLARPRGSARVPSGRDRPRRVVAPPRSAERAPGRDRASDRVGRRRRDRRHPTTHPPTTR